MSWHDFSIFSKALKACAIVCQVPIYVFLMIKQFCRKTIEPNLSHEIFFFEFWVFDNVVRLKLYELYDDCVLSFPENYMHRGQIQSFLLQGSNQ